MPSSSAINECGILKVEAGIYPVLAQAGIVPDILIIGGIEENETSVNAIFFELLLKIHFSHALGTPCQGKKQQGKEQDKCSHQVYVSQCITVSSNSRRYFLSSG